MSHRNVEIQMNALNVVSPLINADECKELLRDCPNIVPFILDAYNNARNQPDCRTNKFSIQYSGGHLFILLLNLAAADDQVSAEIVRHGGLKEIGAALMLNPYGKVERVQFYFQVKSGADILWHILLADNGKHIDIVRKDQNILKGMVSEEGRESYLTSNS